MKKALLASLVVALVAGLAFTVTAKKHSTYTLDWTNSPYSDNVTLNLQGGQQIQFAAQAGTQTNVEVPASVVSITIYQSTIAVGTKGTYTRPNGAIMDATVNSAMVSVSVSMNGG